jgi:spore photoproduct lyase
MIVYANTDQLLTELRRQITEHPQQFFRVGTGELADSLALDSLTRYSELLVEFFSRQSNAVLELKTKSTAIENLLELEHGGRTVVAWSMNPPFIQRTEEHKTATIRERLEAARQCVQAGYPVGFHFDPIIHYPAWQKDYKNLVRRIFENVPVSSVAWISLGALRMPDSLREQVRRRFPRSLLPLGELVPTEDGKLRYFKTIRLELYQRLVAWIREFGEDTPVYACMERPAVWNRAFGPNYPTGRDLGNSLIQGIH